MSVFYITFILVSRRFMNDGASIGEVYKLLTVSVVVEENGLVSMSGMSGSIQEI